jgi:1-deoxy-D-xylulose-5-phosphate reductoisomerase
VLPVDSEHNAIFQALGAGRASTSQIVITASGGPFRTWSARRRIGRHARQALKHPNWSMGAEDHDRFRDHDEQGPGTDRGASPVSVPAETNSTCPSIRSRSCMARGVLRRLGDGAAGGARHARADRALPRLAGADRRPGARLDLAAWQPDLRGARSGAVSGLRLARTGAARTGGAAPTMLNAANEVAVAEFLDLAPRLFGIAVLVRRRSMRGRSARIAARAGNVDAALASTARRECLARELLPEIAAKLHPKLICRHAGDGRPGKNGSYEFQFLEGISFGGGFGLCCSRSCSC